jgi:type VI secretion system secreted protein Hcp
VAVDMFLKFTPTLKGESKDSKHKDEIDILSWSWGASNSGTTHVGGGGGSGKVAIQDLAITKYIDLSSPSLYLACWNGKHLDEATVVARKAGEKPLEYLTITMNEVLITSITTGGSGGEDRFTENVTLNFAKVKVSYKEQSDTGGGGASPEAKWNIAANAES